MEWGCASENTSLSRAKDLDTFYSFHMILHLKVLVETESMITTVKTNCLNNYSDVHGEQMLAVCTECVGKAKPLRLKRKK